VLFEYVLFNIATNGHVFMLAWYLKNVRLAAELSFEN
jgi:hypothetical protein